MLTELQRQKQNRQDKRHQHGRKTPKPRCWRKINTDETNLSAKHTLSLAMVVKKRGGNF